MPRKAVSKKQFRLFKAVEAGDVKLSGLSAAKAKEMTVGQTSAGLPERVANRGGRKRAWRFR